VIAALFVATDGCYYGLPAVDPWDKDRDARSYVGPYPVVAHPPCERWGRYWSGGLSAPGRHAKGTDAGCFAAALVAVRRWGGVLEHPAGSAAWSEFGLLAPAKNGGWTVADKHGGWTCCVEQGHYGHRARKATWLYAVGAELPLLTWGSSAATVNAHPSMLTASPAWIARAAKDGVNVLLSRKERAATPLAFRDLLIGIAESTQKAVAA
jgi:hypothetical protein